MRSTRFLLLLSMILLPRILWAKDITLLTTEYPPFSIESKSGGGLFSELITKAFARKGWTLKIKNVPWARVQNEIALGRADGAMICWPQEIEKFDLVASRAIFISELGFFVRKADVDKIKVSLPDMRGSKVGAVRGYGYPPSLAASGALIDYVQNDQSNMRKLVVGRIDYIAIEKVVGEYILRQREFSEISQKIVWKGPAFARLPLSVGIAKHLPNTSIILSDLNDALESMQKDGSFQSLVHDYNIDSSGLPKATFKNPASADAEPVKF